MSASPEERAVEARIVSRLHRLYGDVVGERTARRLLARLARHERRGALGDPRARRLPFDQRDVVLITYGDSLRREPDPPLAALRGFVRARLRGLVSTIHLLPFFPFSSDDGFAVIDFERVDAALGTWQDVEALGRDVRLVFDFVLNHVSSASPWLESYLRGERPLCIAVEPETDLSAVTRPRALPLLTAFRRPDGSPVHLWTTFSADQVDLCYAEPDVLLAMIEVMLGYVARGAAMLRLDAVAYLWKEIGTSCIHLPQTHEVVRLLRDVLDWVAPGVALLTETNVPHAENLSYFGDGYDEAQLVYNFSLPPLCLHALHRGEATHLTRWAAGLASPSPATTFFNFTASHDGVGVRPLEGLLPTAEIEALADLARERGGRVSLRRLPDGGERPYELNVTYVDALRGGRDPRGDAHHVPRFLASQAVALSLPGVPALYIGSLLGSRNWQEGVERTGAPRAINREKLALDDVERELADPGSLRARVFSGLTRLLAVRTAQPAFHPGAAMEVLALDPGCLALWRRGSGQSLLCLINVSDRPVALSLPAKARGMADLLDGPAPDARGRLTLGPYAVAWLSA